MGDADKFCGAGKKRAQCFPLGSPNAFAEVRGVTTSMKGYHIGEFCLSCRQHGYGWNKGMAALAMDKIPFSACNNRIDLRGYIVIALRWPGRYTYDTHSFHCLLFRRCSQGLWRS